MSRSRPAHTRPAGLPGYLGAGILALAIAAGIVAAVAIPTRHQGAGRADRHGAPSTSVSRLPSIAPDVMPPITTGAVITNAGLRAAAAFAAEHGYAAALSVIDLTTARHWSSGSTGLFSTESVAKLFIAARALHQGGGHLDSATDPVAYTMITQSDDASANALYGRAGGDGVITWVKQALNIPSLGSPPLRSGWWGGTQINAYGMTLFYKAVRARPSVWSWL
ncbi:MAG: hypothetical protein QOG80_1941, partial [Pseudonocardiales bacterium]|nr:hypothetical protein [Pseudonocardiales bacterium]